MLDYLHLPKQQNGNIDYFPGFSDTTGGSWIAWEKPKGTQMIRITCIGGAQAGGDGTYVSSSSATGGQGGGSGGVTILTIPTYVVPDILYVSAGVGQTNTTQTISAAGSYVCVAQSTAAIYTVCYANGASTGLTGATVATQANMLLSSYGNFNALAGQNGAASSGTDITYPTTGLLVSGGASGGSALTGSGLNGGGITAPASQTSVYNIFQTITGGTGSTSGTVTGGGAGHEIYQPLLSCGGGSGGGSSNGTAGNGGSGGFGSGGGGGGGSRFASGTTFQGIGGKGGNGLVIIHSW